jgi:hypothetical protein
VILIADITTDTKPKAGLDALEPWRTTPMRCVHCGKLFSGAHPYASKNAHLSHCKKRILSRYFKVDNFLFVLRWNPLKRRVLALDKLSKDFSGKSVLVQLVLGACEYLKNSGVLSDYTVTELEQSTEMIAYPNGWVTYPTIKSKMQPTELASFENSALELSNRKYNTVEQQNTESKQV